jgi:L,D-transpeptidase catalytic domain
MKPLRYIALFLTALFPMLLAFAINYYIKGFGKTSFLDHSIGRYRLSTSEASRISAKAAALRTFLHDKKFNQEICFLADMQLSSGRNRFFVYNLRMDSVILTGLVAHGSGGNGFSPLPRFSNKPGSFCTALGKYSVGKNYIGSFGLAYKLYGLDSSNSNAFKRNIVLHAYSLVPEKETDPYPICNSAGCAMVASGFLKELKPFIDQSSRPVILWIFN